VEFITTKKGIRWVRVVVPDDLVSVIGKKNLMESLETKDNHVATERAPAVIARFQTQIEEASGQVAWEQIATRANRGPNFLSDTARLCVRVRASRPEPVPGIAAAAIQALSLPRAARQTAIDALSEAQVAPLQGERRGDAP